MRTLVLTAGLALTACGEARPEVIVEHALGPEVVVADIGFQGCDWPGVLLDGERTAVGFCLIGEDEVHFLRAEVDGLDADEAPTFYPYMTEIRYKADLSEFLHVFLIPEGIVQDFDGPEPYLP